MPLRDRRRPSPLPLGGITDLKSQENRSLGSRSDPRRGRPWSPLFCREGLSRSRGLTKVSPYGEVRREEGRSARYFPGMTSFSRRIFLSLKGGLRMPVSMRVDFFMVDL